MSFAPYHSFAACGHLERAVTALKAAGHVPEAIFDGYELYHFSLFHKLKSAHYHVTTLDSYLNTRTVATTPVPEMMYRANFHFDGFLHCLGSALDIFAREILTYFNEPMPGNVYFHTAHNSLFASRPGDAILPYLDTPTWKAEFSDYRNTATHECLIGTVLTTHHGVIGTRHTHRAIIPLPDDPRAAPAARTYRRTPDIVDYCTKTFRRALSLHNQAYEHLRTRIRATGRLPL